MFSKEELDQLRTLIREELRTATEAVVAPPQPKADPAPFWVRPSELTYWGSRGVTSDPAEILDRARYGVRRDGTQALSGAALVAAWDEVERVKDLNDGTIKTFRRGAYECLVPDFAYFGVLTNILGWEDRPFYQPDFRAWAGMTIEQFLAQQDGIRQGPSGGL